MNPLRSISFKLSVLTSLCVLAVIGLMARRIFSGIEEGLIGEMKVRAQFFARQSREAIFPKRDAFSLHFNVEEMLKERAVTYAAVLDKGGKTLSHSDPKLIGVVLTDPFSRKALASSEIELQRFRGPDGRLGYDLSAPISVGSRRVGTARIGFNESSLDAALGGPRRDIIAVTAAATALAVLLTVTIAGWITRPLPMLAAAAREAGKGNFGVRVDWDSADEIGTLSRAFNEMASANATLFRRLGEEREKLAGIFDATKEGIVLCDAAGRIALINPSARALLGRQERSDDALQRALEPEHKSTPEIRDILEGRARITPFQFERREPKLLILSGVADRLGDEDNPAGFLFIFHDATLEKRGETLARSFLSLVTHKLRTPLAVALGFLEVMRGESANLTPNQSKALATVEKENEKLRRLVEKLITFSAAQSPENIVLERADNSLAEVIDQAIRTMSAILDDSVDLKWDPAVCSGLPKARIDPLLIKEVLANLIENAVKFNRAPRKLVEIAAVKEGDSLRVSVRDNGPGIPGEEQGRLFRKFYQIDEHFTGQIPGFGLGLAFAKNVVEAHGGAVGLRGAPGQGSEFYFTLPL
ncbi:MAG: HAMP domain-containing protein [Elusimicrobia bacterium]|nr:HAMP domain-containing protein [Elusimicrobiota bacterium]